MARPGPSLISWHPTMRPRLSLGVVATLVALVLSAAVFGAMLLPWRLPLSPKGAELDQRWHEIEGWAALNTQEGHAEALIKANLAVERRQAEIAALARPQLKSPVGRLREQDLPEEARIALRALAEWDAAGTGLGADPCGEALTAVPALTMGQLLLAVAGRDERAPELGRALRLAAALRTSGDLGLVTIGFNLAEEAVNWARTRGLPPTAPFIEHRPRSAEVFVAATRDAVCTYRHAVATVDRSGFPSLLAELSPEAAPPWIRPMLDEQRELDALRAFHVARLVPAAADKDSFGLLRTHLALAPRDDLPHAALVRGLVKDPRELFERWREVMDGYDAWLDTRKR